MIKISDEADLKLLEKCKSSEVRIEVDGVLHSCVDLVRAVRLINEALAPNGKAVLSVPEGQLAWNDPRARRQVNLYTFKAFERAPIHPSFHHVRATISSGRLNVEMVKGQ